jgi:hypothetical protein
MRGQLTTAFPPIEEIQKLVRYYSVFQRLNGDRVSPAEGFDRDYFSC